MASTIRAIFLAPIILIIPEDFHQYVAKMSLIDSFLLLIVYLIDEYVKWYRLPVFLGLAYLALRRRLHQHYNLINVGRTPMGVRYNPDDIPHRTPDGKLNNPFNEGVGTDLTFFGRNILPSDQQNSLLKPDPMVVATKLLARKEFKDTGVEYKDTGKQFNMLAATWIQFMIHDWIDHLEDTQQIELVAPKEVANQCPLKSYKFYKTKEVSTGYYKIKTGALNRRTPWWDGSAIYGSDDKTLKKVRTFVDGKLKISDDGVLVHDKDGVAITGDARNTWTGLLALQAIFVQEHNAVCDALKAEDPELDDEELYHHARLVTSAVIAKVHTIDWTVELLKMPTLRAGMRANWYGLLGKTIKDKFGRVGGSSAVLSGIVGTSEPENHGVPYSLTEEFVSVYRMHPMLPDKLQLRDINAMPGPNKQPPKSQQIDMSELVGEKAAQVVHHIGIPELMVSMGHQACGALELFNYPMWLRNVVQQDVDGRDRPDPIDLASLEIYRDRERSVCRYNDFRRGMFMSPISNWEDLTDDAEAINTLREVYGDDVNQLDLLVGLMAEKKIEGFAISETAFFIFLIMATRRLEADRFFTSEFNEESYTKKGLEWVNTTESLKDVFDRHYPEMTKEWMNSSSAFSVWDSPPNSFNPIPLYLRIP